MRIAFAGCWRFPFALGGLLSAARAFAADASREALAGHRLGERVRLHDDEVHRNSFQPGQVEFSDAPRRDASLDFDEQILHLTWERNLLARLRLRWVVGGLAAARGKAEAISAMLRARHPSMKAEPIAAAADFEGETAVLDLRDDEARLVLAVVDEEGGGAVVEADFMPALHADFGVRLQQIQREDEQRGSGDAARGKAREHSLQEP